MFYRKLQTVYPRKGVRQLLLKIRLIVGELPDEIRAYLPLLLLILNDAHTSDYYAKHRDLWNSIPAGDRMAISNAVRSRSVSEGMQMEAVTIDGWLRHIESLQSV